MLAELCPKLVASISRQVLSPDDHLTDSTAVPFFRLLSETLVFAFVFTVYHCVGLATKAMRSGELLRYDSDFQAVCWRDADART